VTSDKVTRMENGDVEPKTLTDPEMNMEDVALQVRKLLMIVTSPASMLHSITSSNADIPFRPMLLKI
jgi:hypothetical protein